MTSPGSKIRPDSPRPLGAPLPESSRERAPRPSGRPLIEDRLERMEVDHRWTTDAIPATSTPAADIDVAAFLERRSAEVTVEASPMTHSGSGAMDLLRRIMSADPMFALQFALDQSRQGALSELAELAQAQQATNDRLVQLRKLEGVLRDKLSRGWISKKDLQELGELGRKLGIELSPQLLALDKLIDARPIDPSGDVGPDGTRHIAIDPHGTAPHWQERNKALEDLKSTLEMHKDNIKAESSNRELDLQRATQDYSALMQQLSNISRASYEVGKTIIGNTRA